MDQEFMSKMETKVDAPATLEATATKPERGAAAMQLKDVSVSFHGRTAVRDCTFDITKNRVTSLIGPSGSGKTTLLRALNRLHDLTPGAKVGGTIMLEGTDIYRGDITVTELRTRVGMVFQRPNPFPAMSIYDNVLAGLRFTRTRPDDREALVEESLTRAGLWTEVKNRLRDLGGALSGGQQQRLCIARALAVKPKVLLMDEPCSALDPASTIRIEQTIDEIAEDLTVVIVTHNMQQAQRVSHTCAFFLAAENQPGRIVESGPTDMIFGDPRDPRTADYVHGRFG